MKECARLVQLHMRLAVAQALLLNIHQCESYTVKAATNHDHNLVL